MATRPIPVRFPSRLQLLTYLQSLITAKNTPPVSLFCIRPLQMIPTQGGREQRLNACCRLMALGLPLSNVTVAALSPRTVPIQGDYVP
jgi:hypothetical protein